VRARIQPGVSAVNGDPDRIEQIVWNLLANAVKFTDSGGEIQIDLRSGRRAEIVVSDTGQGMAPEFLPHIFTGFARRTRTLANMAGSAWASRSCAR
jgi:signal transduction histidine kinase